MSPEPSPDTRAQLAATKRHRRRRIALYLAVAVLVATVGLGWFTYAKLSGNITRLDVSKILGPRPSTASVSEGAPEALNILVMGSDSRQGIGTGVFFGMLVAITVGIVFVPLFFVWVYKLKEKWSTR